MPNPNWAQIRTCRTPVILSLIILVFLNNTMPKPGIVPARVKNAGSKNWSNIYAHRKRNYKSRQISFYFVTFASDTVSLKIGLV